ncbi:MAG: Cytochrome bo(3) ubiquinol oxidase subunit 4 [Chlamydiae bacterium]|nr:Cytochrome bo(3) ubiquinol oxidase subunit 4 [Chlamydiota bacterium]
MLDVNSKRNVDFQLPIWGYILSGLLIFTAYFLTIKCQISYWPLIFLVIGLASLQTIIQLVTFIHLGMESKPKWGIMTSLFTLIVLVIVFGGTLWIMKNLSYNLKP